MTENQELLYYYRYGKHNIGITSDDPDIVKEIMDILNNAQGIK